MQFLSHNLSIYHRNSFTWFCILLILHLWSYFVASWLCLRSKIYPKGSIMTSLVSKYNSPTYIVQLSLKHIFLVQFTVNYTNNVTFLGFMVLSRPKIYQSMSNLTSFAPKYIIDFEFWVDFSIKTEGAQARVQNGSSKRFFAKT